jgi:hypothetical protein
MFDKSNGSRGSFGGKTSNRLYNEEFALDKS